MPVAPIFYGEVKGGKLTVHNREKMDEWIKTLDGMVSVRIEKPNKKRSNNQNRYYWAVPMKMLSEHTGFFPDEVHEIMKQMFLREEKVLKGDGGKEIIVEVVKSSTQLSTAEMEDYLARIRQFAASQLNLQIPEPNEVAW